MAAGAGSAARRDGQVIACTSITWPRAAPSRYPRLSPAWRLSFTMPDVRAPGESNPDQTLGVARRQGGVAGPPRAAACLFFPHRRRPGGASAIAPKRLRVGMRISCWEPR